MDAGDALFGGTLGDMLLGAMLCGMMLCGDAPAGAALAPGPDTTHAVPQALHRMRAVLPRSFSSSQVYLAAQAGQLTSMTLGPDVQETVHQTFLGAPLIQRHLSSNHIVR